LTALSADAPEISSAVVAMLSGQTDVGVGVAFGSNIVYVASLLGITAVIAGKAP
jgi:cation:H+ antiporter